MNKSSYTAAGIFPMKLIGSGFLKEGKIKPLHVQLNPTNVCNLSCSFCSCANRNKKESINYKKLIKTMNLFKEEGCQAVTITGGGEPLLYPKINRVILKLWVMGISTGLVTNGTNLHRLNTPRLTWIRISIDDSRDLDEEKISAAVKKFPTIDWSFSYVLSNSPNISNLNKVVRFANEHNFTHVRLVSDLLDLENNPIENIKLENDHLVIYQNRKKYTHGTKNCYISLLKPVIGADGKIYPCCGTQYAEEVPSLDYGETMCMGSNIKRIWTNQEHFDGSRCVKCYYSDYNNVISEILSLHHREFV